jgi:hypothetical protein
MKWKSYISGIMFFIPVWCTAQTIIEFPDFQSGEDSLKHFMAKNLKYPENQNATGTTYISFMLTPTGEIEEAKQEWPLENCPECNMEVLRIIELLKESRWVFVATKVQMLIPIEFGL